MKQENTTRHQAAPCELRPYDAVFLDLDGTLMDTHAAIKKSIEYVIDTVGLSEYSSAIDKMYTKVLIQGKPVAESAAEILTTLKLDLSYSAPEIAKLYREYYLDYAHTLAEPFPGTIDAIHTLSQLEIPLVIVTNKDRESCIKSLEDNELLDFFQVIVADQPGVLPKPYPDSFHTRIAPALNIDSSAKMLMVGDTSTDVAFAHAVNAYACWVRYGFGKSAPAQELNPEFIVDSVPQWADIVINRAEPE